MGAAAMSVKSSSWNQPAPDCVAAAMKRTADFIAWRQNVEQFSTAMGARCLLEHVEENRWLAWFGAGQDPEGAVLQELAEVAD